MKDPDSNVVYVSRSYSADTQWLCRKPSREAGSDDCIYLISICSGRYVSKKDPDSNVVYVSRNYFDEERRRDCFVCGAFNWITDARPSPGRPLLCKVRHGPNMYRWV
jgi:hypothetical protein